MVNARDCESTFVIKAAKAIEEDKDKKMKMSNRTVEEDKPRPMDFAT